MRAQLWWVLISFAICSTVCQNEDNDIDGKSNGVPVASKEFPWMVAILQVNDDGSANETFIHCGGSIINERFVLTAAHCLAKIVPQRYLIRLGAKHFRKSANAQHTDFHIEYYMPHPSFNVTSINMHNVALIKLARAVIFTDIIQPVRLATKDFVTDKSIVVAGWSHATYGDNDGFIMRKVEVPVVSNNVCARFYQPMKLPINPTNLCFGVTGGRKGICQGVLGGPVLHEYKGSWIQVAIGSWGEQCTENSAYSISTLVVPYLDWIQEHTRLCTENAQHGFKNLIESKSRGFFSFLKK